MKTPGTLNKSCQKILAALAGFSYLTADQITKLCYSTGSLTYVKALLKNLGDADFVFTIGGRGTGLPLIYALTSKGRSLASGGAEMPLRTRFRPAEEKDKGENLYFMQHTLAVNDVLIGAHNLAQTVPGIKLSRMVTEHELKRKIYVDIPAKICLEPDASVHFTITETWHNPPQIWEDFFHIEVYRNLPPVEWRFKQKIQAYVSYALNGWHERFFHTPVLTIAVIAQTEQMAATLKRWTEEVLEVTNQKEEGDWFFFSSLNTASASPRELFLSAIWVTAFGTAKTPLLVLGTSDVS
jgi:Replication-relaxation